MVKKAVCITLWLSKIRVKSLIFISASNINYRELLNKSHLLQFTLWSIFKNLKLGQDKIEKSNKKTIVIKKKI